MDGKEFFLPGFTEKELKATVRKDKTGKAVKAIAKVIKGK